MILPETETLNNIIARVFRIDDFTMGSHRADESYIVRYRGELTLDSIQAYDEVASALKPYNITPLFRVDEVDNKTQIIYLTRGVIDPRPSNVWVNIILFILTIFSVLFTGMQYSGPMPETALETWKMIANNIWTGAPFAVSLLGILLAHELGHYFMARYHKTAATLPYFIPFPSILGTLGAVILWKEPPRNRRILFDVGVAGPLAGLIIALPVLYYGLSISKLQPIEATPNAFLEGNSLLYLAMKYLAFGKLLPAPESYNGVAPILYWIKYFFTGLPFPHNGLDVFISPIAFAGWAGLLVTALNLLPVGQLDGGHVMYVLFGKKISYALPVVVGILIALGFVWSGWWLWAAMLFFMGRRHAEPLDQITQIDSARRALAIFMIFVFIIVFMPVPIVIMQ